MSTSRPIVVFCHGLNTFGDDLLHLGPVSFGRMDRHLRPAFEERGVHFVSIDGTGRGSPEQQAEIVLARINSNDGIGSDSTLHLLGHSLGGLVNRVVAHSLKNDPSKNPKNLKIATLVSWGCPHRGTVAADFALRFPKKNAALVKLLSHLGYEFEKGLETFAHYSPRSLDSFNLRYPLNAAAPEHAFLCAVPLHDVSPCFWSLYARIHGLGYAHFMKKLIGRKDPFAPSDGLINIGSQGWGERHGPYRLDHFVQTGFISLLPGRASRERARDEFKKLCDDMVALVSPVEVYDGPG